MIVSEPPYDLVALFADLDMQQFFEGLIERGQVPERGCAREFRWRSLRDPRRDTVWREPERALAPFLKTDSRFLIVWDHQGSGAEKNPAAEVEKVVVQRLARRGVERGRVMALALHPELESLLQPVWGRVKEIVSGQRPQQPIPEDAQVLAEARRLTSEAFPDDFQAAMELRPKEMFEGLVIGVLRLRRSAPLYAKIASEVSLPRLKGGPAANKVAERISSWFPLTTA